MHVRARSAVALGLSLAATGLAVSNASGASIVFAVPSGDWNTASNWSPATVPGTSTVDIAFIRGGRTVSITAPTPVNNPGTSGLDIARIGEEVAGTGAGTLNLGPGGTLNVMTNIELMRRGSLINAQGTLNMTGGSMTVGQSFFIGNGTSTNSANGFGILNVSGSSSITSGLTIGSATQDDGTGSVNVTGSDVTVGDGGVSRPVTVNDFGSINFNLGATVGSPWNYAASAVVFNSGAGLVVDGTNYTGPNGTFTLINGASLVGTAATVDESVVNFAPGRDATINFDTANGDVTLTVTPEPASASILAGAGLLAACSRRRRR
jgi:hypothetical protein